MKTSLSIFSCKVRKVYLEETNLSLLLCERSLKSPFFSSLALPLLSSPLSTRHFLLLLASVVSSVICGTPETCGFWNQTAHVHIPAGPLTPCTTLTVLGFGLTYVVQRLKCLPAMRETQV